MKTIYNINIPGFYLEKEEEWVKGTISFDEHILSKNEYRVEDQDLPNAISGDGKYLIPGAIDAHVHFNDPGFTNHEDFITGTSAAAAGGVTTIVDMPCTSIPPVTTCRYLQTKLDIVKEKAIVDFAFWGGISAEELNFEEIETLWNCGVVGFKIYTISGMDTFKALSYKQIEKVFAHYEKSEILFAFHAEDERTILDNIESFKAELDQVSFFLKTRDEAAEYKAVQSILALSKKNNIHFVHISSNLAGNSILQDRTNTITWETCPHYLEFDELDLYTYLGKLKTTPPVKNSKDKFFLRRALIDGDLCYVASDHAGCDYESEKKISDFSKAYNGIPGTQTMLLYLIDEFYRKKKITLERLIEVTSKNQAMRLKLYPRKGSLSYGADADFVIIDFDKEWIFKESDLYSKGKYSPFDGRKFKSKIASTYVRGRLVYDEQLGIVVDPGWGKFVRRNI